MNDTKHSPLPYQYHPEDDAMRAHITGHDGRIVDSVYACAALLARVEALAAALEDEARCPDSMTTEEVHQAAAALRAYAAQGKRVEELEARAEKAEAALQEAVGLIVLMETSLRGSAFSAYAAACYDFLAKQEGK